MKKIISLSLFLFFFIPLHHLFSTEITVIELNTKSLDQLVSEKMDNNDESEIDLVNTDVEVNDLEKEDNIINSNENFTENISQKEDSPKFLSDEVEIKEVSEITYSWNMINKEDFNYLLRNIDQINSTVIKKELLSILDVNSLMPINFEKKEFDKIIIDSLLSLGNNKKSYELIQNFKIFDDINLDSFYKEFELNYLLSQYNLSEACSYRNEIKPLNLKSENNFFLKLDIFCYILNEQFKEASVLNSLLEESEMINDEYFQYLFNLLQNNEINKKDASFVNDKNIFLYSAMHRVGGIPLTNKFLEYNPLNLSIPIILSKDTNIELRLKAAHLAYLNDIINKDSLSALYQIVNFNSEELNDPSAILSMLNFKIEIGMAYFYQLINIQILPKSRLEAIFKFWDFAEKNNLQLIAYNLSVKNLDTIEPTSELTSFGPRIAKAYTYSLDYEKAKKWLMFSENLLNEDNLTYEFNSVKLLLNLHNVNESENIANTLFENLNYMNETLLDSNDTEYDFNNEILNIIFSSINENIENPFKIEKKIYENRLMPSLYISNLINNSIKNGNHYEMLLSLVASLNNKLWNEIHPEHLKLALECLKQYKDGKILNEVLLEILQQNNII